MRANSPSLRALLLVAFAAGTLGGATAAYAGPLYERVLGIGPDGSLFLEGETLCRPVAVETQGAAHGRGECVVATKLPKGFKKPPAYTTKLGGKALTAQVVAVDAAGQPVPPAPGPNLPDLQRPCPKGDDVRLRVELGGSLLVDWQGAGPLCSAGPLRVVGRALVVEFAYWNTKHGKPVTTAVSFVLPAAK